MFAVGQNMPSSPQENASVLIVDNDPLILTGVAAILDQAGYICYCARGNEAANKLVATHLPDLIIADTDLGDESGLELVRKMKQMAGLSDVPVLFTSSSCFPDMIDRTRAAGGSYYLRKPFDPWVLLELVDRALWMPALVHTRMDRHAATIGAPIAKVAGSEIRSRTAAL